VGASPVILFEIAPDLGYWIPVPRRFPDEEWDSAEQWAEDLAEVAIPSDAALRKTYQQMALDVVNNQVEEAESTLWYSPEDGHAIGTAHLIILDDDMDQSLAELAIPTYESATPVQVEEFQSAVFGQVVQSTSVIAVNLPRDDETVMLPAIGHVRTVGRSNGLVFLLEAFDSDLTTLSFMMEPMVNIFETVTFKIDDETETGYLEEQ
jgi:hypothetical protein